MKYAHLKTACGCSKMLEWHESCFPEVIQVGLRFSLLRPKWVQSNENITHIRPKVRSFLKDEHLSDDVVIYVEKESEECG